MAELRSHTSISARALEFAILTAARSSEALGARWDEIDLKRRIWVVPGERMKGGKEHRVPLAPRAVEILNEMAEVQLWLARWLRARGIEAHVIHAASVAVSREHRRAKTDRLDTEQLKRAFLGWLRGAGPLQDGCHPHLRRGGCQAPPPRARHPRWRAHHHYQPH
jgi:integrase